MFARAVHCQAGWRTEGSKHLGAFTGAEGPIHRALQVLRAKTMALQERFDRIPVGHRATVAGSAQRNLEWGEVNFGAEQGECLQGFEC
ncbi:unannotated protein [freshwater metagenome]|uniref:Unannotated protein n=1 Tax=freshwater metagenome TaxID=449393 RepID=A0A6J6KTZ6_9ZZZZ